MEEAPPDRTGQVLVERYQITGGLGTGAMADVYEAIDQHSNVRVAVKLLNEDVRDRSAYHDRFKREALITAKFRHPTCIRILDYGNTADGLPYQVMEVVRGRQLADILDEEERLPPARALHIFKQLLYALAECGDAGVIHRDIKPENLLIYDYEGQSDALKLIDFGIAKLIGEAAVGHEKLTSVGLILGTPHYIAPEWVTSDNVDCRSDLYSATILLFEMLTSAPPFLSEDRKALMKMHLNDEPPTLRERIPDENFSDALEAMVRKGLAKDPEERFKDARDYLQSLQALSGEAFPAALGAQKATRPGARLSTLPPAGVGQLQASAPPSPVHPEGRTTMSSRKRLPRSLLILLGLSLVALLVALALVDRGAGDGPGDAGLAGDGGPQSVSDARRATIDATPIPVVPIEDADIAAAKAKWESEGLSLTGFDADLEDALANGACRYGKVDELRVLLCLAAHDPIKSAKSVSRPAPGDDGPRKWRPRIARDALHLRVQATGRNKKRKRLRRKIEATFKKL